MKGIVMSLIKEKTYGIRNYHGLHYVTHKEEVVMADGRQIYVPSRRMEAYIQEAIKKTPSVHEYPQFLIVVKMLFGRIPLGATFYSISST